MTDPPTAATQVVDPVPRPHDPRDPLRRWIMADCLAVFAMFGLGALWTPHLWLRVADVVIAVAGLSSWIRLLLRRTF